MARKPQHDDALPRAIAEAASFIASLFIGQRQGFVKIEARTLQEARAAARQLSLSHPSSRRPMVIAIAGGKQTFVPDNFDQTRVKAYGAGSGTKDVRDA
jgi:hypothetical protein